MFPRIQVAALASTIACGGGGGGDAGGDGDTQLPDLPSIDEAWSSEVVHEGNAGLHVRLALGSDGAPGLAYYAATSRPDGPCEGVNDPNPPTREVFDLFYTYSDGSTWTTETVDSVLCVGTPQGLALRAAVDGSPRIASITGGPWVTPGIVFCGANDLGIYARGAGGTWTADVAVASSDEAATGEPASDYGEVVGHWPALGIDAQGELAVAYKDVHAGSIQSDDLRRADLELAWQNGSWGHFPVDIGRSAGDHIRMAFDNENRPLIVYYIPMDNSANDQQGIWAARSSDEGDTWETVRLLAGAAPEGPDVVVALDTGTVYVAYYRPSIGQAVVATLSDPDQFASPSDGWTQETIGDSRYDEGYSPSIAVASDGSVAVAYYRCTRATEELGNCRDDDDGLVFATQVRGDWEYETVDDGEAGVCGATPSLAFASDNSAIIGYMCEGLVTESTVEAQVKVARRQPL